MCTATWFRTGGGYEVCFNRDELRTRKPARPPREMERDGVRILAPEDGDAGGTWLGVNGHGVSIGLANGSRGAGASKPRSFRSRGLLVLDLLSSASVAEAGRRVTEIDPRAYRSFELFAIGPGGEVRLWSFDGNELEYRTSPGEGILLISSSRDPVRARVEREKTFSRMMRERGRLDGNFLAALHASHEPERGAFSPCMHREDASTVSESRIRVDEREVAFAYRPGSPCEARGGGGFVTEKIPRGSPA